MSDTELFPHDTGLVLVDVQQKLVAAMPEREVTRAIRAWTSLLEMAARFRMPVAVSEQYPKGLGPTVPVLRELLGKVTPPPRFVEKIDFNCCAAPLFDQFISDSGRHAWIVAGMESHICVFQTARGLLAKGLRVHVPLDAVLSRTKENWKIGLGLIARSGGVVTSTEAALFDLVKRAEGENWKALARLVK